MDDILQGKAGAPKFALDQGHGDRIEPAATQVLGHVGGIKTGGPGLGPNFAIEFGGDFAAVLNRRFIRLKLAGHESADGIDQHDLLVTEGEIHG